MNFFSPGTKNSAHAESVYQSLAKSHGAIETDRRTFALSWSHNGMKMTCKVGEPLPSYYQAGNEPVLFILDCGNLYKIFTPCRGFLGGEAVLAGKGYDTHAEYFTV